jgi:hypothetical protein
MKHIIKKTIPQKTKEIELFVSPCIKCNSDDITIEEYGDKYGFISTATCKKCGNCIKQNVSEEKIIEEWNNANDIPIVIINKTMLIIKLKQEIIDLKKLQKDRLVSAKLNKKHC